MTETAEIIMRLIGSEVCGNTLSMPKGVVVTDELLSQIFELTRAHDVAHLIGSALMNNNLLLGSAFESAFREQVYNAVLKSEKQSFAFEKICKAFEAEKIPYIPLKGAVIRELYPEPWMRTSCDIDILIHKEDLKKASEMLSDSLGFIQKNEGRHDVSFVNDENICVELHFSLIEKEKSDSSAKILDKIWDYSTPAQNGGCRYKISDEMLYFYHIAHMAKHFENGGCGVRPFIDLWLMENSKNYNTDETAKLLKEGRLLKFAEYAKKLSEVWFSQREHNEITLLMEEFVLDGGCFGSVKTRTASAEQNNGGKGKYVLSRVFVPYDFLKSQYPILKRYKILTPIFEIYRLFALAFGNKKNFRKRYMNNLKNIPDESTKKTALLFESLGLK
ncbi:MAG: nucleotidyltransferase family protein [Clostridia bacterium]|nr:nucleotidyltransferase family protein [Clostridia bacterium]